MSEVRERLQRLDEVPTPELWGAIEGRRPGAPVRVGPSAGGRVGAAILAVAVAVGGTLFAVDRLSPRRAPVASLDPETWATQDVRALGLTFRFPPEWHVQPFDETVGHVGFQGAIVSSADHEFHHVDEGPNVVTTLWDLSDLSTDAVVVSIEHISGGPAILRDREDTQLPLSLDRVRPAATPSPGPGWEERSLSFVLDGLQDEVRVTIGPDESDRDREIARLIVASIAPLQQESFDGWTVDVTVQHSPSGPLEITAGPVHEAARNDAHPWIQHTIVLRNTGDVPLFFEDTRVGKLLGRPDPELFAADQGCGYGDPGDGKRLEWRVCLLYLDTFTLRPQAIERREVTLFKDLRGLAPLEPGEYAFDKVYRYRIGDSEQLHEVHVHLVYSIDRA